MKGQKKQDWLGLVGSEEMDSASAYQTISIAHHYITSLIEPSSVLCVGCSDGTELELWGNAQGIDLNDKSLEKCRSKGFLVHKMDMHDMSFDDNKFELVFARDVFEHSISHIKAIEEYARVSSKYVAIVLPDESWQWSEWHFIIPNTIQMISLGEKVGLKLRAMRQYNVNMGSMNVQQTLYLFEK